MTLPTFHTCQLQLHPRSKHILIRLLCPSPPAIPNDPPLRYLVLSDMRPTQPQFEGARLANNPADPHLRKHGGFPFNC